MMENIEITIYGNEYIIEIFNENYFCQYFIFFLFNRAKIYIIIFMHFFKQFQCYIA